MTKFTASKERVKNYKITVFRASLMLKTLFQDFASGHTKPLYVSCLETWPNWSIQYQL